MQEEEEFSGGTRYSTEVWRRVRGQILKELWPALLCNRTYTLKDRLETADFFKIYGIEIEILNGFNRIISLNCFGICFKEENTMLFERKGRHNTEKTLELAMKRAEELSIRHFVVASNTGSTIKDLLKVQQLF